MRENGVKMGFKTQLPRILLFMGSFGFLQNYSFATKVSNLIYMTTLRFFYVSDSFLMLF